MGELLRLENVSSGYGATLCLKRLSLSVRQGEIVALLGANGAGKTTTLMTISGLVRAREGAIVFNGAQIERERPEAIAARGIGHVPEGRRIFSRLSVLENVGLGAYLRSDRQQIARDIQGIFELFPVLAQRREQLAGTLSGGEQQMLAMARGLMAKPSLLLLDEPSLGLAPKLVAVIFDIIRRIHQSGTTVLLVEQNARMALSVAQRAYILETGTVTLSGEARILADNPRVKAAYLGG